MEAIALAQGDKEEVRQYWNEYVIGLDVTEEPVGSPQFFDDLESYYGNEYPSEGKLLRYNRYAGAKLVEVGCGWGCDLIRFAAAGALATGVDLSADAIGLARQYFDYKGVAGELLVGDAENLAFDDGSFDVAVSLGVLHHTPDTQRGLDEVYRVLRPGGEALIMLYNRHSWYNFLVHVSGTNYEHEEKDAPIVKLYSRREVTRMFEAFSSIDVETTRHPTKTVKRGGFYASMYNSVFVPAFNLLPRPIKEPLGFHIVVRATK